MTNEDWDIVLEAVKNKSQRHGRSLSFGALEPSEDPNMATLFFKQEDAFHLEVVNKQNGQIEQEAHTALGWPVQIWVGHRGALGWPSADALQAALDAGTKADDARADIARVNAACATAKVTPAHSWCSTCGANKPAHKHEPRP